MDKRGNLGIIILLILILILIVIGVVLYVYSKPDPVEQNLTINKTYYDIYVHSNALTEINYVLSNGSVDLVRGTLYDPSIIEEYKGVENNSVVYLSGWSSEYYYNMTSCNVTMNHTHCVLGLDKKALGYYLLLSDNYVSIFGVDGLIQDPLLCFSWNTNVADILANLDEVDVPSDMKTYVDKCYDLPNIGGNDIIFIDIHKNFAYSTSLPFTVYVRDTEVDGYPPIGVRNATLII